MVFQVPPSKASIGQNRFEFQLPGDDQVFSLPLLKYVKPKVALSIETESRARAMVVLFQEYMPEVLDRLEDAEQLTALFNGWVAASGVTLGESEGSSDS
jgi:hypothetical protein